MICDDCKERRPEKTDCDCYPKIIDGEVQFGPLYSVPDRTPSGVWPDVIAPPKYENPAPGWEDPRLPDFRLIWRVARECGYSVGIHGSLKRDVDLIAAPWTDEAVGPAELIRRLCSGLNARWLGQSKEEKPHGRIAVGLQIDGYFKPIDLSIMPRLAGKRKEPSALEGLVELLDGSEFEGCIFSEGGDPWLRFDIDDCGPKEQWDEYCDVLERLKRFGLSLEDSVVEHDCISGKIIQAMEDHG